MDGLGLLTFLSMTNPHSALSPMEVPRLTAWQYPILGELSLNIQELCFLLNSYLYS